MISLSLRSTGHPPRFQPRSVRSSTGSYPRFNLPMGSSLSFGSTACDSKSPYSDSLSLRLRSSLNLAADEQLAGSLCKKHAVTDRSPLPPLVGTWFQVLFHSPSGVLFTFPSRYWSAIGHQGVLSLGGWSPQLRSAFHGSGPTQERPSGVHGVSSTGRLPSVVRGSTRFGYLVAL